MGKAHKMRKLNGPMPFEPQVITVERGEGKVRPVRPKLGSTLLHQLATRVWGDVTQGAGVVLVNAEEVKTAK